MHRLSLSFILFIALSAGAAHCGGMVAVTPEDATEPEVTAPGTEPDDTPDTPPAPAWTETDCAEVKASCGGDPALYVRGHATGLDGLDGGRAEFAVRYLSEEGAGLDVPRGVVSGRTFVRAGAFETCVCVPRGASVYPEIAAVVYLPTTTGEASADVARAMFSQTFATLGDEDLGSVLGAAPSGWTKEAAVAAMVDRTASVSLHLPGVADAEGVRLVAGLVSGDRPIAPQLAATSVAGGKADLSWNMPGRESPTEQLAFYLDRNGNGACDADVDAGAMLPHTDAVEAKSPLLSGPALGVVCEALRADTPSQ